MEETSKAEQYRELLISLTIRQIFQCFEKTSIELVFLSYNQIAIYKTKNRIKEIQCKFLSLLQIDNMVFTIMT